MYVVKCVDKKPNLNEANEQIYKEMLVDKYIAQKNDKTREF